MQDNSFDDYDYTLCTDCHSSIQPYNNISISTMSQYNNNNPITTSQLSSINPYTKHLLFYSYLHCSKCGLYIKIHPKSSTDTSIQKIFICSNINNTKSNSSTPHKYCLCYHCGLLYGINPNQKSIDIISILKSNPIQNVHKESIEEEHSLEVADDKVISSDDDSETQKRMELNKHKIDESYLHLIALQTKLNLLSNDNINNNKINSCPTSPNYGARCQNQSINKILSNSLRGSPLLGPSTPSPRLLGKDVDQSEKKWQKYLYSMHSNKNGKESSENKLEKQQKKLEELQKLQKELSLQKTNSEKYAKLFRNGIYSNKNNIKHMTKFKFDV